MKARTKAIFAAVVVFTGFPVGGLLLYLLGVAVELWTISNEFPISWFMAEGQPLVTFLWTVMLTSWVWFQIASIAVLAAHFWWPARACCANCGLPPYRLMRLELDLLFECYHAARNLHHPKPRALQIAVRRRDLLPTEITSETVP